MDTQIVIWIAAGRTRKIDAGGHYGPSNPQIWLISPMVLIELRYLFEINRLRKPPLAMIDHLNSTWGLKVSDHSFPAIAQAALLETWTRDPFDRLIVAQARSDGYSGLISSDVRIKQNYSKTIWDE